MRSGSPHFLWIRAGGRNATDRGSLSTMGEPALSAEEAQVLAAIVRGNRTDLRNRSLIRLSRLRLIMVHLIMVQGATHFVPTALGYDWHRRLEVQTHGAGKGGEPLE
jgi:hypothetical protein